MIGVAIAAGNTTRDGIHAVDLVLSARSAWMVSIAANFTPATTDAAPHLQSFRLVEAINITGTSGFREVRLRRHYFRRQILVGRGFSRVSF